jgi:hypothetical protein
MRQREECHRAVGRPAGPPRAVHARPPVALRGPQSARGPRSAYHENSRPLRSGRPVPLTVRGPVAFRIARHAPALHGNAPPQAGRGMPVQVTTSRRHAPFSAMAVRPRPLVNSVLKYPPDCKTPPAAGSSHAGSPAHPRSSLTRPTTVSRTAKRDASETPSPRAAPAPYRPCHVLARPRAGTDDRWAAEHPQRHATARLTPCVSISHTTKRDAHETRPRQHEPPAVPTPFSGRVGWPIASLVAKVRAQLQPGHRHPLMRTAGDRRYDRVVPDARDDAGNRPAFIG